MAGEPKLVPRNAPRGALFEATSTWQTNQAKEILIYDHLCNLMMFPQKHGNPLLFRFFQMPMLLIRGEIRCACSPEEGTVVGVLPDRAGSGEKMGHGAAYSHENP